MELAKALSEILACKVISIDTETTGLRPFHGDEPFSIIIATEHKTYYFNLNEYPEVKPLKDWKRLREIFESDQIKVFHNAKFDLHHLAAIGFNVFGKKLDTWFLDRLLQNHHFAYKLEAVAKRHGFEKSKAVDEYIKEHSLSEKVVLSKYNKVISRKHYSLVPLEIIQPYAEKDARITFDLGKKICTELFEIDKNRPEGRESIEKVIDSESRLIDTLFRMEQIGIKIDKAYCEEALAYYNNVIGEAASKFKALAGEDFVKGETVFKKVFANEKWIMTEKGNPSFDYDTLQTFKHPAAQVVCDYSEAKKQLEYFQNFLYEADSFDTIHTDFCQAGAATGRFSARNPNLQNLTNPDKYEDDAAGSKFPVRKAFIPREGFIFVMLDYQQIEYRVMLDRARANSLIAKVLTGLDVHEATAKLSGITRSQAKTTNFLTLYGGGRAKLAKDLKVTIEEAARIQNAIFKAAPEIKDFIRSVIKVAEQRKFITNWCGRRYQYPDRDFCYKAPNHLIQGDCADILKLAMNRIDEFLLLRGCLSRMVCTIHDELIFEIAAGEEHLVPELKKIMESIYPSKRLPLPVDAEYSAFNLADKRPFNLSDFTHVKETRNGLQGESTPETASTPESLGL